VAGCRDRPGRQHCKSDRKTAGGIALAKKEKHRTGRIGWLRAAVLGANDGILSTASLVVGVASADATRDNILIAGVAGLVAGGMSMAAGEYVSVSSQADTENADLMVERAELAADQEGELEELAEIYVSRGLNRSLATEVARQFMAHDALAAHARDELGISEVFTTRPVQAAFTSALSFALGAALPLITIGLSPERIIIPLVVITALIFLALLGTVAAYTGGASMLKGAMRVTFWGALAMAITAGVGTFFRLAS
jgi:VIT1/CCC1 family predicted Fe2+/Mn2+ transporter